MYLLLHYEAFTLVIINTVSAPPQVDQKQQIQWMQAPQAPVGCPPGLEYLSQVDQLLVHQQIELLESK